MCIFGLPKQLGGGIKTTTVKKQLLTYANEDLTLAENHGGVSITGTKLGCIDIDYCEKSKAFSAFVQGVQYKNRISKAMMAEWVAGQFIVN